MMPTGKDSASGKFQPGNTFGRGRPPGTYNKTTVMFQAVGEGGMAQVFQRLYESAMAGDTSAAKILIDSLPPGKTYLQTAAFAGIQDISSIDGAMEQTLNDVGSGVLSLEEGLDVVKLILRNRSLRCCLKNYELE